MVSFKSGASENQYQAQAQRSSILIVLEPFCQLGLFLNGTGRCVRKQLQETSKG